MNKAYFFDTYAIIEIFEGNGNYVKYENIDIILTKLNIFELCHYLHRRGLNSKEIDNAIERYMGSVVDYNYDIIKRASKMKIYNRTLSMVDCIGYQVAQECGINFLTGDKEFEGVKGVEFVK